MDKSCSSGAAAGGGSGMSRAAKKRAKKRQKIMMIQQQQQQQQKEENDDDSNQMNDNSKTLEKMKKKSSKDKKTSSKKNKKRKNRQDDDDHVEEEYHHGEEDHDVNDEEEEEENDNEDSLLVGDDDDDNDDDDEEEEEEENDKDEEELESLEEMISSLSLTPSQILLLSDCKNDEIHDILENEVTSIVRAKCTLNSILNNYYSHEKKEEDDDGGGDDDDDDKNVNNNNNVNKRREKTKKTFSKKDDNFLLSMKKSCIDSKEFYNNYWEKKPLLIQQEDEEDNNKNESKKQDNSNNTRSSSSSPYQKYQKRLNGFISKKRIKKLINRETLICGQDLNITKYIKDNKTGIKKRITLDESIIDNDDDIWKQYENNGCTIRLLCPQKYVKEIHALLSILEVEFTCMVGCNIYLTPSSCSQGFAPHYDDIEAFILQIEGYKHWKVYKPLNKQETLPRISSNDYTTNDLKNIKPIIDVILGPGDVLYIPRGWIHEACTLSSSSSSSLKDVSKRSSDQDQHSLHMTISAYQNWSWADLLDIIIPEALNTASNSNISTSLREGLPRNFLNYMGAIYDNNNDNNNDDGGRRDSSNNNKHSSKSATAAKDNHKAASNKKKNGNTSDGDGGGESDDDDDDESSNDDDNDGGKVPSSSSSSLEVIPSSEAMQQQVHNEINKEIQKNRIMFRNEAKKRIMRVCKEAIDMLDAGCDQIGKRFLSDRLPPSLTNNELSLTSERPVDVNTTSSSSSSSKKQHHEKIDSNKIWPTTLCRLVRPGIARLVIEQDDDNNSNNNDENNSNNNSDNDGNNKAVLYHCYDNSLVYHGNPLSPLEFEIDDAPAIEMILKTIEPHWISVQDLIHDNGSIEDKVSIVQSLYDEGILAILQTTT